MSAVTTTPTAAGALARVPAGRGVTFPRVVASEWIKFRTVRSTFWTLPIMALVMIGIATLAAWGTASMPSDAGTGARVADIIPSGVVFGQLVVAVLGVLTISGEYTTGMIRSTLAAVPLRLPALWAKAIILFVVVGVVSLATLALSALAVQPWADDLAGGLDPTDPDQVRMVLGTALYLATITVFAFAVGALLRHSAGAITVVVGLLLVITTIFQILALNIRFFEIISPFLPSTAGQRIMASQANLDLSAVGSTTVQLTAWQGYGVLAAWTVLLLGAAALLLRRRDA